VQTIPNASSTRSFSSRGAIQQTNPANTGNTFYILNENGNPFDGSQDGAYKSIVNVIDLSNYFDTTMFETYDYYRVLRCETTFNAKAIPQNGGPLIYEVFYVVDRDSRESPTQANLRDVCNRSALDSRILTNERPRQIVSWEPYLIEDSETFDVPGKQVDYTQPRNRWLNCHNAKVHRFGNLRAVLTVPNRTDYMNEEAVMGVRHRLIVEFKGLKSVQ